MISGDSALFGDSKGQKTWKLLIITKTMKNALPLPHPGKTLDEDYMKPLGLSAYQVAKDLKVQPIAVSLILRGKRSISAEMALRLARYTGASAAFWLGLQEDYDLRVAQRKVGKKIERQVKPLLRPALAV